MHWLKYILAATTSRLWRRSVFYRFTLFRLFSFIFLFSRLFFIFLISFYSYTRAYLSVLDDLLARLVEVVVVVVFFVLVFVLAS